MNKKKLIFSYVVQILAIAILFIMVMPIVKVGNSVSITVMELAFNMNEWVDMQEYLFGIAGIITLAVCPLLIITTELCKLSAVGVIKCKALDIVCWCDC